MDEAILLVRPYNNNIDFDEVFLQYMNKYCNNDTIMEVELPNHKFLTINSLETFFEYMFLYNIKDNLSYFLEEYLSYAFESYCASFAFLEEDFQLDLDDFYGPNEMDSICSFLTEEILHNQYNLLSCKLHWGGESVVLYDDNFIDEYTRNRLYDYLLEYGKEHFGYNSLEEFDWWME